MILKGEFYPVYDAILPFLFCSFLPRQPVQPTPPPPPPPPPSTTIMYYIIYTPGSRFSPSANTSSRDQRPKPAYKAKNRYRLPTSAMSLPTLSLDGDKETSTAGINTKPSKRPLIEKSASSASIVRNRDSRVQRLGKPQLMGKQRVVGVPWYLY